MKTISQFTRVHAHGFAHGFAYDYACGFAWRAIDWCDDTRDIAKGNL
jgi:hypothetical protein